MAILRQPMIASGLSVNHRFSQDSRNGSVHALKMFTFNMCAKHFVEHFSGFRLRTLWLCHDFFHTDDLVAFRALAKAMAGAVHFNSWAQPSHVR